MKVRIVFPTLLLLAIACDGTTSPGNGGSVAIRFGAGSSSVVYADVSAPGISADELTVTGTNDGSRPSSRSWSFARRPTSAVVTTMTKMTMPSTGMRKMRMPRMSASSKAAPSSLTFHWTEM